jgi:N-acetyl-D-muramate 6-phosphate phosphatase
MTAPRFPGAVLFDLDGTLLDSAPDMLATVNRMRASRGQDDMTLAQLRPQVSRGGRAMVAEAFPGVDEAAREPMLAEFLATYREELGRHSHLFDGVVPMLAALESSGARWGIVTNKPEALAREIVPQLGWQQRCAVLIGGDTLAERKPHPLPLQVACARMGVEVEDCVYVGDDERDIQAARAAGMRSVVALWGYRRATDDPVAWQGSTMVARPAALADPGSWPQRA